MDRRRLSRIGWSRKGRRRGFTLLEIILAVGLAAFVLTIIATAISTHYRIIDCGQSHIEEAQLARALLRRIADDLRGTVQFNPQKVEAFAMPSITTEDDLAASALGMTDGTSSADASGSLDGSGMTTDDGATDGTEEEDSEEVTAETSNIETNASPKKIPGIYGNRSAIQIDVGRLPRIDQLVNQVSVAADGTLPMDRPSDVKSVAYYTVSPEKDMMEAVGRRGLIRRELDRAVAQFACEQGQLDSMEKSLRPIAPEVAKIEFEYYHGSETKGSWDSQHYGCLPTAVRVTVYITPKKDREAIEKSSLGAFGSSAVVSGSTSSLAYSLLVSIPAAETSTSSGSSSSESSSESGTSKTGSDSSGSGTGSQAGTSGDASSLDGGGMGGPGGGRRGGKRTSDKASLGQEHMGSGSGLGKGSLGRGSMSDTGGGGRGGSGNFNRDKSGGANRGSANRGGQGGSGRSGQRASGASTRGKAGAP